MVTDEKLYFKFFACCVLVQGFNESLIYDIQRNELYKIPNNLVEILQLSQTIDIISLKEIYQKEELASIDNIFEQFVNEEIGFYTTEPDVFPEIDFSWDSPYKITNAIIELDRNSEFDSIDVIQQLKSLGCKAIQIRFLMSVDKIELGPIVAAIKDSQINHVEFLMPYRPDHDISPLYELMFEEPRIMRILIYGCEEDKVLVNAVNGNKSVVQLKRDIRMDTSEIIKVERFFTNIESFSESKNHNLGLNRKVCISKSGELKNYLTHRKSFGNVANVSISDVVTGLDFRNRWFVHNDMIEKCKDCQFRYVCVNNSDINEISGKYTKINECSFNPYTNTWN